MFSLEKTTLFGINKEAYPTCFSDSSGVAQIELINGNPPFIFNWESGANDSIATNLSEGIYRFTITDESGCEKIDSILIENENFEITQDQIDPQCFGFSNGSIEILTANPDLEFSINGVDFTDTPQFDELEAGTYFITTRNSSGCSKTSEIILENPEIFQISLPADTLINLGDSILITPTLIHFADNFLWQPPEGLNCIDCKNVFANPVIPTIYALQATDENGCIATDSITIRIFAKRGYYIPNVFSPNNDGINDFFTIFGDPTLERINLLKVYDRWGELIWEGKNLIPNQVNSGWDGSFRGHPMNSAVFVYYGTLQFIDGLVIAVNGDITLLR